MTTDPNWGIEHVPDNVDSGHTLANTAIDEIVQGVSDPFNADLTSGNVTLTSDEYVLNFVFQCTGHTVARNLTLVQLKKFSMVDNQGTGVVSVILGSTTLTVEVGELAFFYSDGTANNLTKLGTSTSTYSSVSGVDTETGTTHTPTIGQANKYIIYTNVSNVAVTIPPNSTTAFKVGTVFTMEQNNTGTVIVNEGSGVTINKPATLSYQSNERYSVISVIKVATDTWTIFGDLAAFSA